MIPFHGALQHVGMEFKKRSYALLQQLLLLQVLFFINFSGGKAIF
jgi:hypothetical protein